MIISERPSSVLIFEKRKKERGERFLFFWHVLFTKSEGILSIHSSITILVELKDESHFHCKSRTVPYPSPTNKYAHSQDTHLWPRIKSTGKQINWSRGEKTTSEFSFLLHLKDSFFLPHFLIIWDNNGRNERNIQSIHFYIRGPLTTTDLTKRGMGRMGVLPAAGRPLLSAPSR